jgi:hypothetical protein
MTIMRNRWGVEIKKGNWVLAHHPRGGMIEGRIRSISRGPDAYVTLDSGQTVTPDDIAQTLGPMTVGKDGTVKQNPTLRFSDLSIGELFTFENEREYGMARGPWRKTGARTYEHAVQGGSFRVGSVNAAVEGTETRSNPLTRVRIKSPPQRPAGNAETPSPRLMKRRKKTAKAPAGVYANPVAAAPNGYLYCVWRLDANNEPAYFMRAERTLKAAKEYAQSLADKAGTPYGIIKKPL